MDSPDLMDFCSPVQQKDAKNSEKNASPGNNPFDSALKTIKKSACEHVFVDSLNIQPEEYFLNCDDVDISEKESLGILKLEQLNSSFSNDTEHRDNLCNLIVSNSFQTSKNVTNSPLNTGFLIPIMPEQFPSVSTNSISSLSRFNSLSLNINEPSIILSPNSEAIFNDAFVKNNNKMRFNSVSAVKPVKECEQVTHFERHVSLPEYKTETVKKLQSAQALVNLDEGDDEVFEDSVFIEANQLATKFSDGSILISGNFFNETTLDCTTPPELVEIEETEEKIINTEVVFKEIDKIVPVPEENLNDIQDLNRSDNVLGPDKEEEFKENLNNIFNNSQKQRSRTSSTSSSRDPKDLLTNLYSIINNEHRDAKQNEEGQQLLFSLANMLNSGNKCDNLEDSGHSSIEQEDQLSYDHDMYEALDLRVNKSDTEKALNFSITSSKSENKRLSQSFTLTQEQKLPINLKSQSISDSSSINSTKSVSNSKLKPKKLEDKRKKILKGPLKAVIPVMDMSKRKSLGGKIVVTPPKLQTSFLYKVKTSTPINEPQLKPVAQSTPGTNSCERSKLSDFKKTKYECPVSPVSKRTTTALNSSVNTTRSSQSASTPNLSNQSGNSKRDSLIPSPKFIYRRHSATELKTTAAKSTLTRSYSIGPTNKQAIMNRLKQTVSSLTNTPVNKPNLKIKDTKQSNPRSILNENNRGGIVKNMKSLNLLGKIKKNKDGKENVQKN